MSPRARRFARELIRWCAPTYPSPVLLESATGLSALSKTYEVVRGRVGNVAPFRGLRLGVHTLDGARRC
jgi:hypothetical protein